MFRQLEPLDETFKFFSEEYKSAMLLLSYSQPVPGLWVTSSLRLLPLSSIPKLTGRLSPRDPGAEMTSSRLH